MKKALLVIATLIQAQAFAAPVESTRVLKDDTTMIALDLSSKTVFCTNRGYSQVQLKVSVPDLDWLAHFDHRVVGEAQPCITGGECTQTNQPGDLINSSEPLAVVPVRVILSEHTRIDYDNSTCTRQLEETIKSYIRGRNFVHMHAGDWEPVTFEKCVKLTGN